MGENSNLLIILTGKTAAGKDTLKSKLLSRLPIFKKVITTTSRKPRNDEKNGVDLNFVSESDFRKKIEKEDFIEYVQYGGNLYGTEKTQIVNNLDHNLIWRIDPSRAGEVRNFINRSFPFEIAKELIKRVLVIYITVSDEVILQRLKQRGLQNKEIQKRMRDDAKIWQQHKDDYDFVIENIPGKLDKTVDKIINIIQHKIG